MDQLSQIAITMCLSKVTLAAGTTTTISNTGTTTFTIQGKAYTKTAITNGATPTTDAATGAAFPAISANQGTVIVIGLDATGAIKAAQGTTQGLDVSGAFIQAPLMPNVPDTMCPIGYIIFKGGSTLSGTWTFGTSNLSSVTGATYTFVDVCMLPFRPQIS